MAGIFKNNDIRGHYGTALTDLIAKKVGYLFGQKIGPNNQIVIGGDTRESTPKLKRAITEGILLSGNDVIDIGTVPTPAIYYLACTEESISQGIIITGSHNPSDQNGIKICDHRGASYDYSNLFSYIEEKIDKLEDDPKLWALITPGKSIESDLVNRYYENLSTELKKLKNKLVVGIESGGGATFHFPSILEELGHTIIKYGTEASDGLGEYPPDPTKDRTFNNLVALSKQQKIDVGIAFDTDGDRVGFTTPMGAIIPRDKVIMLLGEEVLKNNPAASIIIDVKISKATSEYLTKKGAKMVLTRVGHSYIHDKLLEIDAKMAAELSGHYYFHDHYHGFDDGLYAAVRFLQLVDHHLVVDEDLDEIISELPEYSSTKEFREEIPYNRQEQILADLEQYAIAEGAKLVKIDGIRAEFENGWFIARQSGTEEVLSYRIEGKNDREKDELLNSVKEIISSST